MRLMNVDRGFTADACWRSTSRFPRFVTRASRRGSRRTTGCWRPCMRCRAWTARDDVVAAAGGSGAGQLHRGRRRHAAALGASDSELPLRRARVFPDSRRPCAARTVVHRRRARRRTVRRRRLSPRGRRCGCGRGRTRSASVSAAAIRTSRGSKSSASSAMRAPHRSSVAAADGVRAVLVAKPDVDIVIDQDSGRSGCRSCRRPPRRWRDRSGDRDRAGASPRGACRRGRSRRVAIRWGCSSAFGLVALAIAIIGVYAMTAYGVSRRRREMNIRVALGAQTTQVIGLIMRQGSAPILAGVSLAPSGRVAVGGIVASLLFDVRARDPLVIGAASPSRMAAGRVRSRRRGQISIGWLRQRQKARIVLRGLGPPIRRPRRRTE